MEGKGQGEGENCLKLEHWEDKQDIKESRRQEFNNSRQLDPLFFLVTLPHRGLFRFCSGQKLPIQERREDWRRDR